VPKTLCAPPDFHLSDDQEAARKAVLEAAQDGEHVMVLTGPAGSGKTTLTRVIIDDFEALHRVVTLLAPTGKAATRLAELTGRSASTVHRPLYRRVHEDASGALHFSQTQSVAGFDALVIIDEASMLGTQLFADLFKDLPRGAQVLCVGDREQLEPVNDTWGPDFENPTAALTHVHRQALESPILDLATHVRLGGFWRAFDPRGRVGYERRKRACLSDVVQWFVESRNAGQDVVLLTYTNRTRQALNEMVREAYGRRETIEPGDRILCKRNNLPLGVWNGEVREVERVEVDLEGGGFARVVWTDGKKALIIPWLLREQNGGDQKSFLYALAMIGKDMKDDIMRAEYGECLTVHASQGSQWKKVGIVHDFDFAQRNDKEFYRRLMYTAITRASEELVIFEV
jgi:exodeoxyribonuclease-5